MLLNETNVINQFEPTLNTSIPVTSTLEAILVTDLEISSTTLANYISIPITSNHDELNFYGSYYTIDILMPIFVGLFVAVILGWMLIRYKLSAHQRSNYNGSIYCCPESCYQFCGEFCKCNCILSFKKKDLKNKEAGSTINSQPGTNRNSDTSINQTNLFELSEFIKKKASPNVSPNFSRNSFKNEYLGYKTPIILENGNLIDGPAPKSSPSIKTTTSSNYLSTSRLPFSFFNKRESISNRRDSFFQMPDLMKFGNFNTNVFHSFQSRNSTSLG